MDLLVAFIATLWALVGMVGGQMLNYLGDGFTIRNILGPVLGPIALGIAIWERRNPD